MSAWTQRSHSRVFIIAGAVVLFIASLTLLHSYHPIIKKAKPPVIVDSELAIFEVPEDTGDNYTHTKWSFQNDLPDYPVPKLDVAALSAYPPHRYTGAGHPVYATLYATRNATLYDPYFIGAQQLVYRLLWDPKRKSEKYPVVVFVTPHVSEEHREIFTAQGAIVREVDIRGYNPARGMPDRFQDIFSKLEIWRHTDFSAMMFFDSDAITYKNPDVIFDLPLQHCKEELLEPADARALPDICEYRFAMAQGLGKELNAGVMLLRPSYDMHARFVRTFVAGQGDDRWHDATFEQGLLNYVFSQESPFPAHILSPEWAAAHNEGDDFFVYHGKLWTLTKGGHAWVGKGFKEVWMELVAFYESPEFKTLRDQDRDAAHKLATPHT